MRLLRRLSLKTKLAIAGIALLLLGLLIPPLGRVLLVLALISLIAYALLQAFPELSAHISARSSRVIRKYVDRDFVQLRNIMLEVGTGHVLGRIGDVWFQMFLVEEDLPDTIQRQLRESDDVVLIQLSGNKNFIIVRSVDVERVVDSARLVESMLMLHRIRYRTLNPEEAINTLVSLFRT